MSGDVHCRFVQGGDGTRIFVESVGDNDFAVVLLDGIGCDGFAWRYLQPWLETEMRVVHPHYRGHGRSGRPRDPRNLTIEWLADDCVDVLNTLEVDKCMVIGHSMGTQVALEVARRLPEKVAALVLLCGAAGRITQTFHGTDWLGRVMPVMMDGVERYAGAARALWSRVSPRFAYKIARLSGEIDGATIREEDFLAYWEHVNEMEPTTFMRLLHNAGVHDAGPFLGEIDVPTLVMAAEFDTFTPAEVVETMAKTIPGADWMLLPGASHAAPVEQPATIQLRIEKFWQERVKPTLSD